eukprot:3640893-Amphidinium_carterae.1
MGVGVGLLGGCLTLGLHAGVWNAYRHLSATWTSSMWRIQESQKLSGDQNPSRTCAPRAP